MAVIDVPVGTGQTYTTISAAISAAPTSGPDTWLLQLLDQEHTISSSINCAGRLIEGIEASSGAGVSSRGATDPLRFVSSRARINIALGGGISTHAFQNLRDNSFIRNIQVNPTNNQNRFASFSGSGRVERCILSGTQDWAGVFGQTSAGTLVIANSALIAGTGTSGSWVDGTQHTAGSTIRFVNVVLAGLSAGVNLRQPGGLTVEAFNVQSLGSSTFDAVDVGGGSHNMSQGATVWGSSGIASVTNSDVVEAWPGSPTVSNIDLRSRGSANAAGTRRASDTNDVDVYNRVRPVGTGASAPSMGAWESNVAVDAALRRVLRAYADSGRYYYGIS